MSGTPGSKPGFKASIPSFKTIFWGAFIILGVIAFINWGLLRVFLTSARETVLVVGPQAQQAGRIVADNLPGSPGIQIVVGGKTWIEWAGKAPGTEYTNLWGANITTSNPPQMPPGSGTAGTASTVQEIAAQTVPVQLDDGQRLTRFMTDVAGLVVLVGGSGNSPDFTSVDSYDVPQARQLIADMYALNYDRVNPPHWESDLETAVRNRYGACFQARDLACVEDWGPVQSKILLNPPGLKEWLVASAADKLTFDAVVAAAQNTNAAQVATQALTDVWNEALGQRVERAKINLSTGAGTALDVQWAFAGQIVSLTVDEGWQLPGEMGGSRGKLSPDDKVQISGGGQSYTISGAVAAEAMPGVATTTPQVAFSEMPTLFNQSNWLPGQPLP